MDDVSKMSDVELNAAIAKAMRLSGGHVLTATGEAASPAMFVVERNDGKWRPFNPAGDLSDMAEAEAWLRSTTTPRQRAEAFVRTMRR